MKSENQIDNMKTTSNFHNHKKILINIPSHKILITHSRSGIFQERMVSHENVGNTIYLLQCLDNEDYSSARYKSIALIVYYKIWIAYYRHDLLRLFGLMGNEPFV